MFQNKEIINRIHHMQDIWVYNIYLFFTQFSLYTSKIHAIWKFCNLNLFFKIISML